MRHLVAFDLAARIDDLEPAQGAPEHFVNVVVAPFGISQETDGVWLEQAEDRRLTLNQAQMGRLLYTNVFGLPLLIIGLGTWVWWRRR